LKFPSNESVTIQKYKPNQSKLQINMPYFILKVMPINSIKISFINYLNVSHFIYIGTIFAELWIRIWNSNMWKCFFYHHFPFCNMFSHFAYICHTCLDVQSDICFHSDMLWYLSTFDRIHTSNVCSHIWNRV
jgi:hypothetical protein